ncbi:MAG: DUF2007 domain-containing protein [Gammaproteobacteria bacterium]
MHIVYKAQNITEAHIVDGLLRANGIESHVGGHYLQGGVGDLAAFDFANIHVANKDIAVANEIIAEYEGNKISRTVEPNNKSTSRSAKLLITIFTLIFTILIYYLMS